MQASINTESLDESQKNIPYGRQYIDDDDIREVIEVLQSDWLTQGPKSREFEEKFAAYCGAKYAVSVTSGTAALHLACLVSEIGEGDEVITSPITFAASSNCALYVGASPVFIDIDPETICLDHKKLDEYLNIKPVTRNEKPVTTPKAVIPVHFAGLPCRMEEISNTARARNLVIIEDACHALGAEYPSGDMVGSCKYSDMTVFSFHPVKHIATGEGGMITTNSPELYDKLLKVRSHGITKNFHDSEGIQYPEYYYEMQELGFNYRMTDIQCALGISQLKKLDKFIERRRSIVEYYNNAFSDLNDAMILPYSNNSHHAWHIYVVQLLRGDRDSIFAGLKQRGIGVQVHYIPVYLHPFYRNMGFNEGLCPHAEEYFSRTITLPIHPSMSREDMKRVVLEVRNAVNAESINE